MSERPEETEPEDLPPELAALLARALDRSPSAVVMLLDADLRIRWLSHSARWVTGTDPSGRKGADSLERIHPDDIEPLLHGLAQLRAAKPREAPTVPAGGPLRYRFQRFDGRWVVMEAQVHNLLDDPVVQGMLVEARPVGSGLDGVGHVVDLLVAEAPLPDVLAACAGLVSTYVGSTAVVGYVDGEPIIGATAGGPASVLAADDRWWRDALAAGDLVAPVDFAGFPEDLAVRARDLGFRTVWVLPVTEPSSAEPMGCVVVWVLIEVELNVGIDDSLRQATRLAGLVIGEERRRHALRREAVTDPLTGLGNRSALRRRLDDAAAGPVTLALVDLDDFKPINDTYGHATGDAVLRAVAERLREVVRADDLVVRFGGDEFAVVFAPDTSREAAALVAERIVAAVQVPLALDGVAPIVTGASIGLATAAADQVVHQADKALYQAKRARNRGAPQAPAEPASPDGSR
jgi:diguanylate cyclase (GGDEF)-like protein